MPAKKNIIHSHVPIDVAADLTNKTVREMLAADLTPYADCAARYVIGEADPNGVKHVVATIGDFFGDDDRDRAVEFMSCFAGLILVMPGEEALARLLIEEAQVDAGSRQSN